jgi:PadR family transcriptional regulator, regulatory protein PadR
MKGHHRRHRARSRAFVRPGHWAVRARVERFVEPSLLLLLRERPMHGYELIERLPEIAGAETRIDVGNLYRVLRALEEEGIVTSEWSADLPGPAKRTYELTTEGRRLLDRWAEALRSAQRVIAGFLDRYEQERR